MCLITEQTKPIKIRKDRTVYKVMMGCTDVHAWSSHSKHSYTFGFLDQTDIKRTSQRTIYDGVASDAYGAGWVQNEKFISYGQGFHSMKSIKRIFEDCKNDSAFNVRYMIRCRCVVECTIPKGSLIYEDKTGLLISNQIIINHEVMKDTMFKMFKVDVDRELDGYEIYSLASREIPFSPTSTIVNTI